jgi:four helix bundle protein
MDNATNAPVDMRDRTLGFSREVIRYIKLQKDPLAQPLNNQIIRSATSIGANFAEAKNAASKKDFRHKVFISKKEAAETLYWLHLYEEFDDSSQLKRLQTECQEMLLILQKIITTLDH